MYSLIQNLQVFQLVTHAKNSYSIYSALRCLRMCIFFLAVQPSSPYVLIAANNRDEFFARETTPAAFWEDEPGILAGWWL